MRLAGIDCGTNSIRLLIGEVDDGQLRDVVREMRIVRLGEGVDATGRLAPAALARTFEAAREYASMIREAGVNGVRFVATSASRDAENSDEFADGIAEILGVEPEVISGGEEASLSFLGATRSLSGLAEPALVVDIGGGSTEFVLGDQQPIASISVDMGCVRMAERHIQADPPTAGELSAIRADVRALLDRAAKQVSIEQAQCLVGLAGTVTTVAALALDLDQYRPEIIHGARISAQQVYSVADRLAAMTHDQRAALPVMHPGRVDVIVSGSVVLAEIVRAVGLPQVIASEHDILDGILWSQVPEV